MYIYRYMCINIDVYIYIYIYTLHASFFFLWFFHRTCVFLRSGVSRGQREHESEQFRKHLHLNMAAPQTFARTFTKPGSRLY